MVKSILFVQPKPFAESQTAVTSYIFRNRKTRSKKNIEKDVHHVKPSID